MKKLIALVLMLVCALGMAACTANGEEAPAIQSDATAHAPSETDAEYGCLQELVDSYGLPICLRMTEEMELTVVEISEDHAERYWTSSLSNSPTMHEDLTWSIVDNHLVIGGDWEEEFTINVDTWRAVSALDGKEYRIVIYDENGEVVFSAPFDPS